MSVTVNVNGEAINYPQTGDTGWGDEATDFAVQTSSAFAKLGLSTGTTVDIQGTLDVTGNVNLDANLTVLGSTTLGDLGDTTTVNGNSQLNGTLTVTGNSVLQAVSTTGITLNGTLTNNGSTILGDSSGDTLTINGTAISIPNGINIDSNTLVVDATNNRVGIVNASPTVTLDVTGDIKKSGVDYNSDGSVSNPSITFTSDTNTGLFRSASDQIDIVTGGESRFRVESTGQIKAVYESTIGTDYNTTLGDGYFCRAWVNFNGTGTVAIRASGNVSSITDNGTGDYTINFTTAMPDTNYSVHITVGDTSSPNPNRNGSIKSALSAGSFTIVTGVPSTGTTADIQYVCCAVFR